MKWPYIFACASVAFCFILGTDAHANFGDFFGPGVSTTIIGGQANQDPNDPNNNYYAPALLSWPTKINASFNHNLIRHDFKDINNVVIKNSTNNTNSSNSYTESGNIPTDYPDYRNNAFSFSLPLRYPGAGAVNLSIFAPMGKVLESNSGHPTRPEYVMYHSRYRRSMVYGSYSHPVTSTFGVSLGVLFGFQTGADVTTQASLSGTGYGSSASAKAKVTPSLGAIVSLAQKFEQGQIYFTFTQEMKQNLKSNVIGETNDPPVPFDIAIETMLYYDPYTFRLGGSLNFAPLSLYASLEYQLWHSYKTPLIHIHKRSTIESSDDYEKIKTKNILVPHLGLKWDVTDQLGIGIGGHIRPTPLEGTFSGPGNSIDSDSWSVASGPTYKMTLFGNDMEFGASAQYTALKNKTVTKTTGQENGNAGSKIGAPGYEIGGNILSLGLGLRVSI